MSSINGFIGNITGTSSATGVLESKNLWRVYVLPRGAHASAAGSASPIVFDSSEAASRFSANDWVQVGTDINKIRQVAAVGGNSISYSGSAMSVAASDRIFRIGTTQPTVTTVASYQPHTTIYPRDDDGSTPVSNSLLTTDANGLYQFWAADDTYDLLVQDANQTAQGSVVDVVVGFAGTASLVPTTSGTQDIGTSQLLWDDFYYDGCLISGKTSVTGGTAHCLDTTTGITLGNYLDVKNNGTTIWYGDTYGGIYHSYNMTNVANVKSARFGAKGDGTTNDTSAIQAAIDYIFSTGADGVGGIVYFPAGIYMVSSQLTITGSRVILRGDGNRTSIIRATAGFSFNGTTDAVVRIGSGAADTYSRLENMQVDCNNVANSIGVYSTNAQEQSGLRNCIVNRFRVKGVFLDTGCQNWSIISCDFGHSASSTTAIGLDVNATSSSNLVMDCTFNDYSGAVDSTNAAIRLVSSNVHLLRIHVEHFDIGLDVDANSTGHCAGLYGHSSVTTLAIIRGQFFLTDLSQASGTNLIGDNVSGITFNQNSGWYWRSNDGGAGAKTVFSSTAAAPSRLNSPTTFGTTLVAESAFGVTGTATFRGPVVLSTTTSYGTFTGSTILNLSSTANVYGISAPTGGISGITPITDGRIIHMIAQAGTLTFTAATSFNVESASLGSQDRTSFICIGTTWYEMHPRGQ